MVTSIWNAVQRLAVFALLVTAGGVEGAGGRRAMATGAAVFPLGACSVRACEASPVTLSLDPWAPGPNESPDPTDDAGDPNDNAHDDGPTPDGFCFHLHQSNSKSPCVDANPASRCCDVFRNTLNKIVLKSRPACRGQVLAVTVDGVRKAGGVGFVVSPDGTLGELRISSLATNASAADGKRICLEFLPGSACSSPDAFFGDPTHPYALYDVARNLCCPTCMMNPPPPPDSCKYTMFDGSEVVAAPEWSVSCWMCFHGCNMDPACRAYSWMGHDGIDWGDHQLCLVDNDPAPLPSPAASPAAVRSPSPTPAVTPSPSPVAVAPCTHAAAPNSTATLLPSPTAPITCEACYLGCNADPACDSYSWGAFAAVPWSDCAPCGIICDESTHSHTQPQPQAQPSPSPQPSPQALPQEEQNATCDTLHFGLTCGVPLGKNCPWASRDAVPAFFTLTAAAALEPPSAQSGVRYLRFTVHRDPTLDLAAWIAGPHPTTGAVGPITQIIFSFPQASYAALAAALDSSALTTFLEAKVFASPGSVTALPNAVNGAARAAVASVSSDGADGGGSSSSGFSTRAGNVGGVTGYYVYNAAQAVWADGQEVLVPEAVVRLMPTLPDGTTEYSFYGSEAYCRIQRVALPAGV